MAFEDIFQKNPSCYRTGDINFKVFCQFFSDLFLGNYFPFFPYPNLFTIFGGISTTLGSVLFLISLTAFVCFHILD